MGFDGNESNVTLEQSAEASPASQPLYRAVFSWNFGDENCGDANAEVSGPGYSAANPAAPLCASVFHTYQYAGTFNVTLTVTNAAGDTETVTNPITVLDGKPCDREEAAAAAAEEAAGAPVGRSRARPAHRRDPAERPQNQPGTRWPPLAWCRGP